MSIADEPEDPDAYREAALEIDVAFRDRVDETVPAGAARLPYPPKESTYRTYDPKDVKVTWTGKDGKTIELKGFESPLPGFVIGFDPGDEDLSAIVRGHVDQAGTRFFDKPYTGHRRKLIRRRVLRARAKARKRRRGW